MAFSGTGPHEVAIPRNSRNLWHMDAVLLGLPLIKLFLIERASTGTIGRTISFLPVGLLMVLIGPCRRCPGRIDKSAAE